MPIDNFPPAPVRGDRVSFPLVADAFVAHFEVFVPQANAQAAQVNADAQDAEAARGVAESAAQDAITYAEQAAATAGFAGLWSSLTGPLNVPASVYHADTFWVLLSNLADVTTAEPGVSAAWVEFSDDYVRRDGDTATDLTINGLTIQGAVTEQVFAITGTTPAISAANGTIQTWALTANSAPTYSLNPGESVTLMIDDGTARTITWPTTRWVGAGGLAPVLSTTGYNVITLWRVGADVFGTFAGAG